MTGENFRSPVRQGYLCRNKVVSFGSRPNPYISDNARLKHWSHLPEVSIYRQRWRPTQSIFWSHNQSSAKICSFVFLLTLNQRWWQCALNWLGVLRHRPDYGIFCWVPEQQHHLMDVYNPYFKEPISIASASNSSTPPDPHRTLNPAFEESDYMQRNSFSSVSLFIATYPCL